MTATSRDRQTITASVGYTVIGKPKLTKVRESSSVWRAARKSPHITTVPTGTRFSFKLDQNARVSLNFYAGSGKHRRAIPAAAIEQWGEPGRAPLPLLLPDRGAELIPWTRPAAFVRSPVGVRAPADARRDGEIAVADWSRIAR